MMTRVLVLAAFSFVPSGGGEEAGDPAGVVCDRRDLVLKRLEDSEMHETVRMSGSITDNGDPGRPAVTRMEITAGDNGERSWSLIMTDPKTGRACLVVSGDHFEVR